VYDEVNEELPFFVRMTMVEVNGIEIKTAFLNICQQMVSGLIRNVQMEVQRVADEQKKFIHGLIESISF